MQKKLIALAVAGLAASTAFAQSNVTIYGRINTYVESIKNGTSGAGVADNNTYARTRLTNNSSNVGFRGEEDLGGGLKAWFQVESDVSPSDGGGSWSGRNSGVGLKGSWGQLMAGSWDAYYADHLRATGMGLAYGFPASDLAVINQTSGVGATVSFGPTRARNQIRYTLPNFSGFTGYLAYSAGNVNLLGSTNAEAKLSTTGRPDEQTWIANGSYNAGPIFASLSYFETKDRDVGAGPVDGHTRQGWKLAGSYDFASGTHLGLTYEELKAKLTGTGSIKKRGWVVNVAQTFGAAGVGLYYGQNGDHKGDATAAIGGVTVPGSNTGAKYVSIQGTYNLSKRTTAYAGYARIRNETAATYDFFGGLGGAGTTQAGSKPTSMWLGMSHAF